VHGAGAGERKARRARRRPLRVCGHGVRDADRLIPVSRGRRARGPVRARAQDTARAEHDQRAYRTARRRRDPARHGQGSKRAVGIVRIVRRRTDNGAAIARVCHRQDGRDAAAGADATVFAPLTQPEDNRRRRRTLFAIGAALLILLLLTGGVLVFETTRLPTLDVSPKIATFGEHVVVTATRVPRDQTGEIRLESVLHTFPFRADKAGKVSAELAVPNDIATGDHILRICWDGQCRAETTL